MPEHADLASEQAHIDYAYRCLEEMRRAAERLRDSALGVGAGGTHQGKFQRDVFVQAALERLEHLEIGRTSLIFGRIDNESEETFYIGRRAVSGPNKEAVVVDWRAPAAAPFYRATARDPQGLILRRHFATQGQRLLSIEDERFSSDPDAAETGLAGSGALMAALGAARTGYMRDIVATVQKEQDEIIRADMPGVLAVQGGPGTGKTAVALHRAAFLLFTYRKQIGSEGMLFIGPNRLFLRYISRVLPALGESGAILSTPEGLVSGVKVTKVDPTPVARVKGGEPMGQFLRAAVALFERPLTRDLKLKVEGVDLRLNSSAMASIVRSVQRVDKPHNQSRVHLERQLAARLHRQLVRGAGKVRSQVSISKTDMASWLADDPSYVQALDQMWPTISAEALLQSVLSDADAIGRAGAACLDPEDLAVLTKEAHQPWVGFSQHDLPLIDELRVLVGEAPREEEEGDEQDHEEEQEEEVRTYRHIVVDEAQDLSPMQLRMLARRSANGSMTIVGDLAQGTAPAASHSWEGVFAHLPKLHEPRLMGLSVNYRTPKEIMDVAVRLLGPATQSLAPERSVRQTQKPPILLHAHDVSVAASEQVANLLNEIEGNLAVICPVDDVDRIAVALKEAGVAFQDASEGMEDRVVLAPVDAIKGLEFDAVVLVDPGAIAARDATGGSLYVAMTRATQRLVIVAGPGWSLPNP